MGFETPADVKAVQDALEKAKQASVGTHSDKQEIRAKEEELAEAMLSPTQIRMSKDHEVDELAVAMELEDMHMSFEDLKRFDLHFEGVGPNDSGDRVLKGIIIGKKDKNGQSTPDHSIEVTFSWNGRQDIGNIRPNERVLAVSKALVDGVPVDKEIKEKIFTKYFHIARLQERITMQDKEFEPALDEEKRKAQLIADLDL